jgi:hypothetical protein
MRSSATGGWYPVTRASSRTYTVLVDVGKLGSFCPGLEQKAESSVDSAGTLVYMSCLYSWLFSSISPGVVCSVVLHVVFLTYRLQYGVCLPCLPYLSLTMISAIQTGTNYLELAQSICAERRMGEKTKTVGYQRLTCRLSEQPMWWNYTIISESPLLFRSPCSPCSPVLTSFGR